MHCDESVKDFKPALHPRGICLEGENIRIVRLDAALHGSELFEAYAQDKAQSSWHYLPYGPFEQRDGFLSWLQEMQSQDDPCFFALIRKSDQLAIGVASFLRIKPEIGVIEVGHIHFSPLLQRSKEASEAMFLMMDWVFSNGYRRYEWKCNARNIASRAAAQRLGFSYEGVFRQATIYKNKNRDTAWFGLIDKDWPAIKACFLEYLSADNFDAHGQALSSLRQKTKPLLFKKDEAIA